MSVQQFIPQAVGWLQARADRVRYNWPVKGGWEGWVQVDLPATLIAADASVDILREQQIYQGLQRVDLLFNANTPGATPLGVELKAESFENRVAGLLSDVKVDIAKVEASRGINFGATPVVLLVIVFNEQSLNGLLSIQRDGHGIFRTVFMDREVAMAAAVHHPTQGWAPAHPDQMNVNEQAMVIAPD